MKIIHFLVVFSKIYSFFTSKSESLFAEHFYNQCSAFKLCFSFFVVCIFPFFQFFVFQVFSFHFQFFPSVSVNVECMKLQLMLQFRKKEGWFKFFVSSSKWWSLLFSNLTYMNYDNPKSDHTDRKQNEHVCRANGLGIITAPLSRLWTNT